MFYPMRPSFTAKFNVEKMRPTEWAAEPKLNGKRIVVFLEPHRLVAWNRHGALVRLPTPVRDALIGLGTTAVLDGELVGRTLHVFDAPLKGGDYTERRLALAGIVREDGPHLRLVAEVPWTPTMYEDALAAGHEGLVFKRRSSLYVPGRHADDPTYDWLKLRGKAP